MGCWLLNLLFALIGILVIDNWFAKTRQKIPYYVVLGDCKFFCVNLQR